MIITIQRACPRCHKLQTVKIDQHQYHRFMSGVESIQTCFPNLKPNEREILMSGLCPKCWDILFPPDEDDWIPAIYQP